MGVGVWSGKRELTEITIKSDAYAFISHLELNIDSKSCQYCVFGDAFLETVLITLEHTDADGRLSVFICVLEEDICLKRRKAQPSSHIRTVPAIMTESVLAGPNFSVISCLCLCTAKWSSLVNLWKK